MLKQVLRELLIALIERPALAHAQLRPGVPHARSQDAHRIAVGAQDSAFEHRHQREQ